MRKFHKTFGWVVVKEKKRTSCEVELENGEIKEIKNDYLFDSETEVKKPKKPTQKDLRAVAHTMSAEAVKEHIEDIESADALFWALWKVFKYERKWSKSLKASDFAVHFNK
jgi:hypothetical protein